MRFMSIFLEHSHSVNCFYCASGNSSDIFQLANIYGGYELKSDALFQSTRIFDEDCGKNLKKYLKVDLIKSPNPLLPDNKMSVWMRICRVYWPCKLCWMCS